MWIEIAVVAAVLWTPVDAAGRRESADVADVVVAAADEGEVGVEQLFVLDALDAADHTPRQVVVDARHLSGPPDQGDDRERTACRRPTHGSNVKSCGDS
jgi:hypothetical protein